ncbi:MAG: DegT/DnrJ/EryC1/StrS family aminotransferase, partial [bacterium]
MKIPMSSPELLDVDIAAVNDVLDTRYLSLGPRIEAFEDAFAALIGTQHAVGVNSGTSGLHLAVIAAGVGQGDLVITTPFSFIASANCILFERATPVFVDIDPDTLNIDPDQVA